VPRRETLQELHGMAAPVFSDRQINVTAL
jgi:hypothetical protein